MVSRTAITATASVVGVIVAGTAAVGANIGILTAADSSEIGELSAAAPTESGEVVGVEVVDVYLDDLNAMLSPESSPGASGSSPSASGSSTSDSSSTYEAFAVDAAGELVVENYGDRIELDSVSPSAGYTYSVSEESARQLTVTFEGPTTLVFKATLNADGTISASVEAPVIVEVPAPGPSPTVAPGYDDDDYDDHDDEYDDHDEDDDHDDHDEDDDEDEDDEDDEDDEHEGHDDDD